MPSSTDKQADYFGAALEGLLAAKYNPANRYTLEGGKHFRKVNIAGIWSDSGEWIAHVDTPHPKVDFHHININPRVSGVRDPHIPLSESTANAIGDAYNTLKTASNYIGYATTAVDAYRMGKAFCSDLNGDGSMHETKMTATCMAGGFVGGKFGAYAGSAVGSQVGGLVGMVGGPAVSVVAGAIGCMVGGVFGAVACSLIGRNVAEDTYKSMHSESKSGIYY